MTATNASQPDTFKPGKTAMNHPSSAVASRLRLRQALACLLAALQAVPLTLLSDVAQAQVAVTPQQTSPTQYRYDAQGNLTQVIEPDSSTTDLQPDRLHRTKLQTQPAPKDGAARPVIYKYRGQDRLLSNGLASAAGRRLLILILCNSTSLNCFCRIAEGGL